MPVNISIKNAPDELVSRLKRRAAENHRSMQGEVIAILDQVTREPSVVTTTQMEAILAKIRAIGHPNTSDSVQIIRDDRDRR